VFAFRSEIWIVRNFNFTVFEDFCLSLSWKCRFLQNVNHAKVQSKTNNYCKFHVDLTRRRLSKSRFKKLGMVPKKLYRNTLTADLDGKFFAYNCCMRLVHVMSATRKSGVQHLYESCTQHEKCRRILKHVLKPYGSRVVYDPDASSAR